MIFILKANNRCIMISIITLQCDYRVVKFKQNHEQKKEHLRVNEIEEGDDGEYYYTEDVKSDTEYYK